MTSVGCYIISICEMHINEFVSVVRMRRIEHDKRMWWFSS
jgi:hypothetical protein